MGIQNQFKRMKRTGTLHDYFSSDRLRTPPKGSGFFDLSYSTRCSIYDFAGLTDRIVYLNFVDREYSDSHLSLSTDLEPLPQEEYLCEWSQSVSNFLHGHVPRSQIRLNGWLIDGCCDDLDFHCNCDPVPSHLLWVSPRLAHDASKAFFSRNRFYIHGAEAGGLSGLRSLNSTCLRWIKSLTINLNVDQEFESYSYKFASHESTYARPFWEAGESSGSNKKTKELRVCHDQKSLIHDWAALCHYLADFSLSKDLKLSLICNVVNLTVAEEITTQLLRLPILKDCAINLRSHGTDRALYRLSKKAALKVTGRSMNSFRRFLDLPNELQIKILEQTNIIAPHALAVIPGRRNSYLGKYIGFSRHSYMYFVQQIGWHYLYEGHYRERDWSRGYFQCCRKCSDTWFQACCCWTRHSAMSTTCVCWQPPSLLSVSHAMRRICEPLFYSKNYFVVLAEPPNDPRDKMSYELHHFLSSVSLAARQHLRLIRWVSPIRARYPGSWTDCLKFVDTLATYLDITKLELTIDLSLRIALNKLNLYTPYVSNSSQITYSEGDELDIVEDICSHMTKYQGWQKVFFCLSYPLDNDTQRHKREIHYERMCVGKEYDSAQLGKREMSWH